MKENRFTDDWTKTFDIRVGKVVNMPMADVNGVELIVLLLVFILLLIKYIMLDVEIHLFLYLSIL